MHLSFIISVTKSYLILWDPTDCSLPGFPVLHHLPEFAQSHVHWVDDAIQPSHPLLSPSPPALNLSQHQGLFQWVGSSHQVARVLELQHQLQFFQGTFRVYHFIQVGTKTQRHEVRTHATHSWQNQVCSCMPQIFTENLPCVLGQWF